MGGGCFSALWPRAATGCRPTPTLPNRQQRQLPRLRAAPASSSRNCQGSAALAKQKVQRALVQQFAASVQVLAPPPLHNRCCSALRAACRSRPFRIMGNEHWTSTWLKEKHDHDRRCTHPVRLLTPLHQPTCNAYESVGWSEGALQLAEPRALWPRRTCKAVRSSRSPLSPQTVLGEILHVVSCVLHTAALAAQRQTSWCALRAESLEQRNIWIEAAQRSFVSEQHSCLAGGAMCACWPLSLLPPPRP